MAVPLVGVVALAEDSTRVGGVASVPVSVPGISLPLVSTQMTVTEYVVPGARPVTEHFVVGQLAVMQELLGGRMGHSRSLKEEHWRPAGGEMLTSPLVPLTNSVELIEGPLHTSQERNSTHQLHRIHDPTQALAELLAC